MMGKLWLGALLFAGPHLVSTVVPALRDHLKERLGEAPFKGLYALVSLVGVVLLVLAVRRGRIVPPSWKRAP